MTRLRTFLKLARLSPAIGMVMLTPTTPAHALPTCYSRVSQMCSVDSPPYGSYEACMENLMPVFCPDCTSDPDSGGGLCTVFP